MQMKNYKQIIVLAISSSLFTLASSSAAVAEKPVDFNRDIRPILSENCFYCHGSDGDQRQADLRVDTFEGATGDLGGYAALVPGDAENSEMFVRLTSHDEDTRMPPADSNRSVSAKEIDLIRRWINEGGEYATHWAFQPVAKEIPVPDIGDTHQPSNPIDAFVGAALLEKGMIAKPPTEDANWLRRIYLDTNGLPPTSADQERFAQDLKKAPEAARSAAVDRVLANPHYGERLASDWLDVARYADTHGFNNDTAREMWRWRDWVIDAFNDNKPYDEFITEQLAGDLLPEATLEQKIATGFGRNHGINSEGGIIDEEYRVEYVADRVRTLGMAWLGLTLECARCHDHKYDPISQKDYYRFFAFFDNIAEIGETGRAGNAAPLISAPTTQQLAKDRALQATLTQLQTRLNEERALVEMDALQSPRMIDIPALNESQKGHLYFPEPGSAKPADAVMHEPEETVDGVLGKGWACSQSTAPAKIKKDSLPIGGGRSMTYALWIKPDKSNPADVPLISNATYNVDEDSQSYGGGVDVRLINGAIELRMSTLFPGYGLAVRSTGMQIQSGRWQHICVVYDASEMPKVDRRAHAAWVRIFIDGVEQTLKVLHDGLHEFKDADLKGTDWLIGRDHQKQSVAYEGAVDEVLITSQAFSHDQVFDEFARAALPMATREGTDVPETWLASLQARLGPEANQKLAADVDAARTKWIAHQRHFPNTMIMAERAGEKRKTRVRVRGTYSALGAHVSAGVPERLLGDWPEGQPKNRLGLARWLTQEKNPLTARVVVNRVWQHLFGIGLVKTTEDFGFQAEYPSHPQLLDYLARDFIDSGWDLKSLYRQILLSSTYRQSSVATAEEYAADPENRLLARAARLRLPAETIRDQALAISGLLADSVGGPSVRPYQPKDLYTGVVVGADYTSTVWHQGEGDDLYRRSLYTFWKRTIPHPAMLTFDAPDREFCTVRRETTNTPLQALNLMNAPIYIEASNQLARQLLSNTKLENDQARLKAGFKRVVGRAARKEELDVLLESLRRIHEDFSKDDADAKAFVAIGSSNAQEPTKSAVQHAALASVVSMMLNLDEAITKH